MRQFGQVPFIPSVLTGGIIKLDDDLDGQRMTCGSSPTRDAHLIVHFRHAIISDSSNTLCVNGRYWRAGRRPGWPLNNLRIFTDLDAHLIVQFWLANTRPPLTKKDMT